MSLTRSSSPLLLSLALVACDGAAPVVDAGHDAGTAMSDAGPPDAGPPLACTDRRRLDGVLGETVSTMFDTRMTETRPRDLGLGCGNVEAELRWAPQEVVELHVPGTGPVAVELDTVFDGDTDIEFNTVLQVRRECERAPAGFFPPTCFDDVAANDFRSRGAFTATGGEVVYIFVTGYSAPPAAQGTVDRGRVRLDVRVRASSAPTLTSGSLLLALDDVQIQASGTDADADARGVAINFYTAAGLLDIYGDGEATEDGDVYVVFFDPAPTATDYTGSAIVRATDVNLGPYLRAVGATHARFRAFDVAWALSAPLMVDIEEAELVGFGEECDSTRVCRPEMTCVAGTCGATGAVATACGAAIPLSVPPPEGEATSVTRAGSTGAGRGNFLPSSTCASPDGAVGAEAIYSVTVPEGLTADLLVTTDLPGSGSTDTILYVRRACADSGTELACNDDLSASNLRSSVEVRDVVEGTYFVFVERYGGLASGSAPHELRATLRPVLGSGEPCDGTGTLNRCAAGACTGGVCP